MKNATAVPTAKARVVQVEMRQAAVVRVLLRILQNVPDTADGLDQGPKRFPVDLGAQAINVNVNYIGRRINSHAPDVVKNHSACHHASGISTEILQQRKFMRSQLQ